MIVFFLPDLRAGGAERVMLNLLLRYHKEHPDKRIILLLFKKQGPLLNEVPLDITVCELKASGATKAVFSFSSFCKIHQPKIVFSSLGASLTTSLAKPFIDKKTILINRIGNTIGAEKLLFKNPIKRFFYINANRIIAKMSNHIIFQCNYMADDYSKETKIVPKKYSIIYNPVQVNKINKLAENGVSDGFTFVAIGRLNPQKDYESLIKACAIVKQRTSDFSLAVLGEGNLREKLESLIIEYGVQKHVFLLGYISNPYPYMKQAKYLVSSSLYEGFSNVIIESLCIGTPVIATDCPGGNAEVIQNGENGWLCEYKNPEALANAMHNSLNSRVILDKETIAQKSEALFSDHIIFKEYDRVIANYW